MMNTTDLTLEIYKFIVDNFMFGQADGLGYDESLLQRGVIDSTGVLELLAFLEENFRITVNDNEVIPANFETVSGLANYIQSKLEAGS
jgi:acyl carrier protein